MAFLGLTRWGGGGAKFTNKQGKEAMLKFLCYLIKRHKIAPENTLDGFADAFQNETALKALQNAYAGKRCVLIGGAPSLSQLDLSLLKNEYTFTVGRGYRLKEKGLSHSSFHVLSDVQGYAEFQNEIDWTFSDVTFFASCLPIETRPNRMRFAYYRRPLMTDGFFQTDLTQPLYRGHTVMVYALQIAYFLGFRDIYFIGVDLDFKNRAGHAYGSSAGECYRQQTLSVRQEAKMRRALVCACRFLKRRGCRLYNASPAGSLDFMECVSFNEVFHG